VERRTSPREPGWSRSPSRSRASPCSNEEIAESYIEIVDLMERAVVTIIEVLSPANKASGSASRRSYLAKRRLVMRSPTHLVEIDLLRT
jgi:hypothetical protein